VGRRQPRSKSPRAKARNDPYDPDPVVGMAEILEEAGRQQEARDVERKAKEAVALEQAIARERQRVGMVDKGEPRKGDKGGAPRKVDPAAVKVEEERRRKVGEPTSLKALARHFGVHRTTIGRSKPKR
jgi:hypothetical protein